MQKFMLLASILAFLLCNCSKETFEVDTASKTFFHVKNGDYLIPVLLRGNTASKKIILYVQGGPAGNTLDFATVDYPEWKNTLEKDYAIAYYEQRGTGNRQGNFDFGQNILQTYIEDLHKVAAFLKKAYGAEIIMMGHSFGGGLTLRYMIEYGQSGIPQKYIALNAPVTTDVSTASLRWQFRRAFLFNTAKLEISRNRKVERWNEVLKWLEKTPVIEKIPGDAPYQLMQQWNEYIEELVYPNYAEKNVKVRDYLKAIFFSPYNPIPAYLRKDFEDKGIGSLILQEEEDYVLINRLSKIDQQAVLLITGRYDDICVPEELSYVFEKIPSPEKQIKIIDEAGHDSFLHQAAEFNQILKSFIQ
ncbi:MAG TPA: alpha/beta hydrolase [Haliscomenobacter sp.]|uniref:alpha/beta hydrolase n=1 Tax=Haliscomenobacter sp. TaxID=2717303 RepID=UPI002B93BEBA|nr:alpha/beta hydrolase [Haliscomenobacter sp.]HOY18585.1 alpha/beta hydrolase [Haliscomenobacter sp.]